MGLSHLLSRSP